MIVGTPKFDAALDKILSGLTPHLRDCVQKDTSPHCEKKFKITDEDIEFLKLLRVPPPKLCPTCRKQRRLSFFNWTRFFKRPCDAPGHSEQVIASVSLDCPFPVVDIPYYQSADFDPTLTGSVPDINKSFRSQLYELRKRVPLPSIVQDASNVNSEYSMGGRSSKNVYYSTGVFRSEDILYSNGVLDCHECAEMLFVRKSDRVYEAIKSDRLSNSSYIYFSRDCIDSIFLFDCRNCSNCFGCVNLRNKNFCFFNEQLSRNGYIEQLKKIDTGDRNVIRAMQERFWKFVRSEPLRASQNVSAEDSQGVYIARSKNCCEVADANESERVRHSESVLGHHDSMDVSVSGGHSHHLYETANVGSESSAVKFSCVSKFVSDSEFLLNCKYCQNCFGCVGLENKSFHIFNKPYEPEEYWNIVDGIKCAMLERGEYGAGIPISFSPYGYNNSFAHVTYPCSPEVVARLGGYWQDESESNVGDIPTLASGEVVSSIDDVTDDITARAILSERSGRPFRITPQELALYRKLRIPVPSLHPYERMEDRIKLFGCYKVHQTVCARCGKAIYSALDPAQGFTMYCDNCYTAEVV
ncbi:MAG: hypothetical protein HY378_00925 [Candidatus Brennerbacteria bacterium]|nr:hypothetical protein [Candidatus Brennerbacteria bacterium]